MIHWDQLFGVLSAAVRFVDLICDPADLVVTFGCALEWPHFSFMWTPVASFDFRKMKSILERIDIRKWIGERAQIKVTYLTACRDWTKWLLVSPPLFSQNVPASVMPYLQPAICPRLNTNLPVTFQGGLKTDETGNHAFLFMRRRGQENWLSSSMLSPSSFEFSFHMFGWAHREICHRTSWWPTTSRSGELSHMSWMLSVLWNGMQLIQCCLRNLGLVIVLGRAIFYDGGTSVPEQFLQLHLLWHHISFPHRLSMLYPRQRFLLCHISLLHGSWTLLRQSHGNWRKFRVTKQKNTLKFAKS